MIKTYGFFGLFGLVLMASSSVVAVSTVAAAEVQRQVTVSGSCIHDVSPDRAHVILVSEFTHPSPDEAFRLASDQYERLRKKIKSMSLKDLELQTSESSVEEVKEWENNKTVSRGFRARMGLKVVSSSTGEFGEVIALAAKEKVKDIGRLSFSLSTAKERSEYANCLEEAAQHAKSKADKLAKALGASVKSVLFINESGGAAPTPYPYPMADGMMLKSSRVAMSANEAAPSVETGLLSVSVSVSVGFSLE
jgi:uncharacterized protein YggE